MISKSTSHCRGKRGKATIVFLWCDQAVIKFYVWNLPNISDCCQLIWYPISRYSRGWCFRKKKKHLQDSSSVCPCLRLGSLSDPHAGQCLNPWGIWFDFLYHLHYTELRVNIVELKWRLMFCYWCVSIKGRHEVKAEWVYLSYWERLHILNHLEQHFTEKTWNSNLI